MAGREKRKGALSLSSSINLLAYRALFGLLVKVRPPSSRKIDLGPGSKVLVFSTAGLGDSLLDSAGIRALAETFPGIHLEAVVHHRRRDISSRNPFLKKLHFLRKGPTTFWTLWQDLRRRGPWDAVLYLSCHDPEARCLGYLLARDATIGLARRTKMPWLCARNIDEPGLHRAHLAAQAVRVAQEAGASEGPARMVYDVVPADREALDRRLSELGFPSDPGVVFQLGGGGAAFRDWPADHFIELARMAHSDGIGPIFLLGGPDHRTKAMDFAAKAGNLPFFDAVGKLPLPQSAALIERARCLVSTDTGIMHLAFAIGTPTVAILHCSPGSDRVGPAADLEKHVVVALPRPDGYTSPRDASMTAILPEQVFPGLKKLFDRNA
ncbi:MAG: glycosyltransferase family 9 protein [Verrucomicrobiae bacterium]